MSEETGPYDPKYGPSGVRMGGDAMHHGLNRIKPTTETPIQNELRRLDGGLEVLEIAVAGLIERLHPLLAPCNAAETKDASEPSAPTSPLHGNLWRQNWRVALLTARVQDMLKHLTL